MDNGSLRAILNSQYSAALASSNASKLSGERQRNLSYYQGDVSQDMPVIEGRSTAVSMDVADTIDGVMPNLMEIFHGDDEVVRFNPVSADDVQAAQQETDYVRHVYDNLNPGFQNTYEFLKDGFLNKVGFAKVWAEKEQRVEKETYYGKTDDEYALIVANKDIEVIAHSAYQADGGLAMGTANGQNPSPIQTLHDVQVQIKKDKVNFRVAIVPPEEAGIDALARNLRDCNYFFHRITTKTEADWIADGFDEEQCKKLPTYRAWSNTEEVSRDTIAENQQPPSAGETSGTRLVEVVEHYIRIDYEGDGQPCLYMIDTGGQQGEILKKDGKDAIFEIDNIPFAAWTPMPMPHRFFGNALADRVIDIQKIKTAVLRGGLDSIYQALNPKVVVSEAEANENTLDDLLVSRPNQIVRVRANAPTAITYQTSPDMTGAVFPLMEYMDGVREWRTGISKAGQGIDANALMNQSATAVNQAFTASQAKIRLLARIAAEGFKDIFWLLHALIKKHATQQDVIRLRGEWVTVDPRNWKTRNDLTVQVGLGTGSRAEQMSRMMVLAGIQEKLIMAGKTNIATDQNLFNNCKEMTKIAALPNVEDFFTDPSKVPPPQPQPNPEMVKAQAAMQENQQKAQLEQQKAQTDTQHQLAKLQADMALLERRYQLEEQKMLLDAKIKTDQHQMDIARHTSEMQMKRELHAMDLEKAKFGLVAGAQKHQQTMEQTQAQ